MLNLCWLWFWRDSANDDPVDILDIKSENLADSMASFVQSTVTEIGTVDPEGNFLKLLEKGEPFNKCKFAFMFFECITID